MMTRYRLTLERVNDFNGVEWTIRRDVDERMLVGMRERDVVGVFERMLETMLRLASNRDPHLGVRLAPAAQAYAAGTPLGRNELYEDMLRPSNSIRALMESLATPTPAQVRAVDEFVAQVLERDRRPATSTTHDRWPRQS